MKNKMKVVVLSLALILVLAGCGKTDNSEIQENEKEEQSAESVAVEETSEPEATPMPEPTPPPTLEVIKVDERYEYKMGPDVENGPVEPIIGFNTPEGMELSNSGAVGEIYTYIGFMNMETYQRIYVTTEQELEDFGKEITGEKNNYILSDNNWSNVQVQKKTDVETPFGTAEIYYMTCLEKYSDIESDMAQEYAVLEIGENKILFEAYDGADGFVEEDKAVLETTLPQMFKLE